MSTLLPTGSKAKPDVPAITQAFNHRFILQQHAGGAPTPDQVINSKSPRQVKSFLKGLEQSQRGTQNKFMGQALVAKATAHARQTSLTTHFPVMPSKRARSEQEAGGAAPKRATVGLGAAIAGTMGGVGLVDVAGPSHVAAGSALGASAVNAAGALAAPSILAPSAAPAAVSTQGASTAGAAAVATTQAAAAGSKGGYICMECLLICNIATYKGNNHSKVCKAADK
jgi:hypothetical protein